MFFQGPGEKRGRRSQNWKLLGVGTFREGDQQLPVGQCPVKGRGTLRTDIIRGRKHADEGRESRRCTQIE